MAGAQAADLPVKAKPVQYVKICSLYGAGFYYIPGTDTCIKIGGFIRAEMNFNSNGSYAPYTSINFDNIDSSRYYTRVRGLVSFDVRSQTEYGTLRGYVDMSTQDDMATAPAVLAVFPDLPRHLRQWLCQRRLRPVRGLHRRQDDLVLRLRRAALLEPEQLLELEPGRQRHTGVLPTRRSSATASRPRSRLKKRPLRRSTITGFNSATAAGVTATAGDGYAGKGWPDLVANLRVDQAWGSAQIMGAIHDVNAGYYTAATTGSGSPGSDVGYALGAGIKFNLPMIGKGDYVLAQFNYAKGALNYLASDLGGGGIGLHEDPKRLRYRRVFTKPDDRAWACGRCDLSPRRRP